MSTPRGLSFLVLTQYLYCLIMIKTNNNKIHKRQKLKKRAIRISVKFELDIAYVCVCVCVGAFEVSYGCRRYQLYKIHKSNAICPFRGFIHAVIRWEIILMCFQFLDSGTRRRVWKM